MGDGADWAFDRVIDEEIAINEIMQLSEDDIVEQCYSDGTPPEPIIVDICNYYKKFNKISVKQKLVLAYYVYVIGCWDE